MKPRFRLAIIIVFAVLTSALLWWALGKRPEPALKKTPTPSIHGSNPSAIASGSPPLSASATPTPKNPLLDNPKVKAMLSIIAQQNAKSLDFYGKVVDQHGQPVSGVSVKAGIGLVIDFEHSGGEDRYTVEGVSV